MTDIPIIFSSAMVRALLDGRKTMTRRILKPQLICTSHAAWPDNPDPVPSLDDNGVHCATCGAGMSLNYRRKSGVQGIPVRFSVGDRLWVRETVACGACAPSAPSTWSPSFWRREQGTSDNPSGLWYAADSLSPRSPITDRGRWVPSIHMPRWASRITDIVTAVKIERLQDITEADAIAEGVLRYDGKFEGCYAVPGTYAMSGTTAVECFSRLWMSLHGAGAWDANPFVVATSFRVIKANIDAPEARIAAWTKARNSLERGHAE